MNCIKHPKERGLIFTHAKLREKEEGEPGDRAFLLATVEEGEARGPWVEEGGPAAAVEEGEPCDRAFLLAAVEEGEARGP